MELNLTQQKFIDHVSHVMHCIQHKGHNDGKWAESFSAEYLMFLRINSNF